MTDDGSSVDTPWGKIKGLPAIVVVLLAVALGGTGYVLWNVIQEDRTNSKEQHLLQQEWTTKEHKAIVESVTEISQALEEQNWIILLNEAERKEIKERVRMPHTLREKMERP